ncbi:PAS domain S-box protein [Bacillus sp. HMF5848]|uniref:sigma-54 interaction domain-containing protein n=1 Tax=Bacillus sp. HMF5848 TaxID=2495421 RepID=UPI000F78AB4A|nr:sigma-54-dependent Fis family transcriptional regulator [Bacillus sp. HMF5848]RSK27782.1 PAS domain S-box protein [Bacillus sp. HMF5848]
MQKVLLVGAGAGGTAMLTMLIETEEMNIVAVIDKNLNAPGVILARKLGIHTDVRWEPYLDEQIDIVIEATGSDATFSAIRDMRSKQTVLIPGAVAHITARLFKEKEKLIETLKSEKYKQELIFNTTSDGMIVIDTEGKVILFNKSAEKMAGISKENALNKHIHEIIPSSKLPRVLATRKVESNQELVLANRKKIITTRMPMISEDSVLIGAVSIFKDISDVVELASEITNLKEVQTMLEAIIRSSEEAISVVDENGLGLMINGAYTRLTGLTEEDVIGKPATIDISEGESMHMKVLQTRRAVRGVRMKVGPNKRDVVVNVAPIIVDGKLKGSVGVIQDVSEIQQLTSELNRARQIIRTLEAKYAFEDIIGSSEEMQLAIEQAKLGAKTPATVLLRGESGTGKELFAHAIHNASERRWNKFIRVNCAAISETLLESELFGYDEGAFSGAKRGGKRGFFEEANNGSIFLDEIGELSANTQVKLLRVLQEGEIIRVGGTKPIPINVRVIAATHVNLEKAIATGSFREDLYYRLNRLPIRIPPLRNRLEDIPDLCKHLLSKINQDYGRNVNTITDEALRYLSSYHWPGNVRELENVLGRAIIFLKFHEKAIDIQHIPQLESNPTVQHEGGQNLTLFDSHSTLQDLVDRYEAKIMAQVLDHCEGNKTEAARLLGISLRNLYYKLDKYKLAKNSMQ